MDLPRKACCRGVARSDMRAELSDLKLFGQVRHRSFMVTIMTIGFAIRRDLAGDFSQKHALARRFVLKFSYGVPLPKVAGSHPFVAGRVRASLNESRRRQRPQVPFPIPFAVRLNSFTIREGLLGEIVGGVVHEQATTPRLDSGSLA